MAPERKAEERGSGGFVLVNERAKMKESSQSDRKIRVQDDNITENTNVRSPLTFRKLLYVVAYMQSQKTPRKRKRHFV